MNHFLIHVVPKPGADRLAMYNKFEHERAQDKELNAAVTIQSTYKLIGRDEVYLIVTAENLLFLEQILSHFEKDAQITVTPLVELT